MSPSLEHFEAVVDASKAMRRGEDAPIPAHFSLNFESEADLPPAMRKDVAKHGWEVAAGGAWRAGIRLRTAYGVQQPMQRGAGGRDWESRV